MSRRIAALGLGCVLALLVVEASLRGAAWLGVGADERLIATAGGFRILCVGDSNTYGAGIPRDRAYPAELQRLLDARDDGVDYRVLNLGIPATNSSQLLQQLPGYLESLSPSLVIATIGVNDSWNSSGADDVKAAGRPLHDWLLGLRTYKLVFLTVEGMRRRDEAADSLQIPLRRIQLSSEADGGARPSIWEQELNGRVVTIEHFSRDEVLAADAHRELLAENLVAIAKVAAERGIPIVFASYAPSVGPYAVANRTILDLGRSGHRVLSQAYPAGLVGYVEEMTHEETLEKLFLADLHPTGLLYAAMAAKLADYLESEGLLPTPRTR